MPKVYVSAVIEAPTERIWAILRDFNALPRWVPAVAQSRIEQGWPPDRVGCVRAFTLKDGGRLREQLLALSDYDCSVTYSILESPMAVQNYVATLRLFPVTDSGATFAEWSAEFDCAPDRAAALSRQIGEDVFAPAFAELKRQLADHRSQNGNHKGRDTMRRTAIGAITLAAVAGIEGRALAQAPALPPLHAQPGAQMVVDEHLDALNKCDWNRLMAQYPPEVEFQLPNGVWIKGREKIGELFAGFCKPHSDGGFRGLTFRPLEVYTVDGTVSVTWEATADFLDKPYRGADAYITKDGLMYAQVTTFNPADMKMK
jgi:hypothetical protein